ncbi:MAG: pitrilysin family protein [Planctomycetota bacterium]
MKPLEVETVDLDNGFRALLVERRTLPVVASVLWYRVGSRDERSGETGLSHFLEHMMFKGTDRFAKGEIDALTNRMGGSNNAFTDCDSTAYYFSLAADRWETALEIEASRMKGCLLDPAEFESEKKVVLEELAMGEDDPWRPLYQEAEAQLFQVHPYHHPVIGYRQDLERLTPDRMRAYYERNYGPNRAILVVVGAIDRERTRHRIEDLFGCIGQAEQRGPVLDEPEPRVARRSSLHTDYSVARLCVGFPTCRMGERDDYALDVLANALGMNKSSRLYKRLVLRDELVSDVSVINEPRFDPGGFFVLCELREGADPDEVERGVREEVEALAEEGVPAADARRIREQIRASFLFQDETALDQAMKLARFEALTSGGHRTLENVLPTYASLRNPELKRVAARYLDFRRAAVVWAHPRAEKAERRAKRASRRTRGGKPRRGKG